MGSSANIPQTWIPYANTKDCSQGFCTMYCPQWCYIIFPPPPPFDFPDDDSGPNFSPLVISIIAILASAFLLVSYYAIISKYCKNRESTNRRQNQVPSMELEENQDRSIHGQWHVPTDGLHESLIKSITMFKYKKGDGLFEGTDCSVCLSEFQEDESLRLLPKCSHAFHANCIDTWLKSHSNCPLCRANIIFISGPLRELPSPAMESPSGNDALPQPHPDDHSNVPMLDDIELGVRRTHSHVQLQGQRTGRCLDCSRGDTEGVEIRENSSWDGLTTSENGNTLNEIRVNEDQQVRRSVSMDIPCQRRVSIADILSTSDNEDEQMEKCQFHGDVGTSKGLAGDMSNVLHCVTRPVAMKRSFSSGRFTFCNQGRGRNSIIPL